METSAEVPRDEEDIRMIFNRRLRWKCLDFVRTKCWYSYTDQTVERLINEARVMEEYIRKGKVPPWKKKE